MHPKALLDVCSELVRLTLKFDHPTDAIVARFFRDNRGLGPRERATLAGTVFTVLRKKLLFDHYAPSGSGPKERRLAILGFYGPGDFLRSALSEQEKNWLDQCEKINVADLMERHRHNLPEWLVQPLKEQLGAEFWPLAESLNQGAGLDLRVNALNAKRADVQKELAQAGIKAVPTPYSPWGLRIAGKPTLNKLDAFTRGAFEVQDEGAQLLAMLLDAKRGEMVVDFCAGAGGKTLAIGAAMRSTGRLYAFDTSAHRLDALKPRLARAAACPMCTRRPLPMNATNVSSACRARLTGCWWMHRVPAWARCGATRTSNGGKTCSGWLSWPSRRVPSCKARRGCSNRVGAWCMRPVACWCRKTRRSPGRSAKRTANSSRWMRLKS